MMRLVWGEFAPAVLTGQKVPPPRLLAPAFSFDFPTNKASLENLLVKGEK
jgi:NAD dependent epimerase/dehydratase family enzyme